jgi:hypothetical protein
MLAIAPPSSKTTAIKAESKIFFIIILCSQITTRNKSQLLPACLDFRKLLHLPETVSVHNTLWTQYDKTVEKMDLEGKGVQPFKVSTNIIFSAGKEET